jgi:formylglycine-generating enzyme required for sulfatase activity
LPWSRSPSPTIVFVVVAGVFSLLALFLILGVSRWKETDISKPQVLPEAKPPATGDPPTVVRPETRPPTPPEVSTDEPDVAIAPFDATEAKLYQQDWANRLKTDLTVSNSIGMQLRLIPPGEFMMGSPASEWGPRDNETLHVVRITKPFYLSATEVTQAQYERVMGTNPSHSKGPFKPVEKVSWHDAMEFFRTLSVREGEEYRLPTEAEWEYACRAGTTTAYSFGDDTSQLEKYAWYTVNSGRTTHAVGAKLPNAWGLYDMHGNVWEWCQDWYGDYGNEKVVTDPTGPAEGRDRVLRGGAFSYPPMYVRAALRANFPPVYRISLGGCRLARTYNLSP